MDGISILAAEWEEQERILALQSVDIEVLRDGQNITLRGVCPFSRAQEREILTSIAKQIRKDDAKRCLKMADKYRNDFGTSEEAMQTKLQCYIRRSTQIGSKPIHELEISRIALETTDIMIRAAGTDKQALQELRSRMLTLSEAFRRFGFAALANEIDRQYSEALASLDSAPPKEVKPRGYETVRTEKVIEPTSSGTCFFVNGSGLAVTNYHVVEARENIKVFDSEGESYDAEVVRKDPANDLISIKALGAQTAHLPFAPFGEIESGQEVFTLGYPLTELLGEEVKFTDGVVSSTRGLGDNQNIFQMTVPIQPGNSGGPVVNYKGQIVGIATSQAGVETFVKLTGAFPQSINWAVRSEYAQILTGIAPATPVSVSRDEAIRRAKKAVCRVVVY
jgi:S1-C subfamily serine protease